MDNIRIIYRILSVLEASMDTEAFDERSISPETLGITRARLLSLLRMLLQEGLIEGISVDTDAAGNFLVSKRRPRITMKGLEYLNENSLMQRAMRMAKGINDCVPGI
jgi:hypothetical protein